MNTNNLTTDEAERYWYCLGWPAPQRSEDLDDALECERWRSVVEAHSIDGPSDLDRHLTETKHAQAISEALDALADWLNGLPLGDAIGDFMFAPDREDLAVGLDRIDRPGWCPMVTAPLDGKRVDLWVVMPEYSRRETDCFYSTGAWWSSRGESLRCITHWMAIPSGPAA